jgi:hypothetical protein
MSWLRRASDGHTESEGVIHPAARRTRDDDVTERTRLLPEIVEPEVEPSPYNLSVVRTLRNISKF